MKKALVLILAFCLIVGFSACSTSTNPTTSAAVSAAQSAAASAVASAPAAAETVALTAIMVKHPLTQDLGKMDWLTKIEKNAGVSVTWQQVTDGWDQKKGTLLASGDLPDLIVGGGAVVDSDFSQFPGLFADLTPYLTKDAPNIEKMFTEHPETLSIAKQLDGKIYGIPKYQRFWPQTLIRNFINKDWLTKLNLQVPTTWDELYNVLVAFKTKDPNGNGQADEIPMDWAPGSGGFNVISMLDGYGIATNLCATGDGYYMDNGVVKNYYTDTRYKELVTFLNKCWNAGLINTETFTNDYTKFQAVTRATDAAKVGFTWGWEASDRFGSQWYTQYETIAPMKPNASYNGPVYWDYSYNNLNYGADMIEMSAKTKSPDAAVRFMDQFYDPIVSIQVLFGSIPTNISDDGAGNYAVLPPTDPKMDPGTWKWTSSMADDGPMYIADSIKLTLPVDMQRVNDEDSVYDPILKGMDTKHYSFPYVFIKKSADDNNTIATLSAAVNNLTFSSWSNWIAKGGVDADWDAYVSNCDKAGMTQIIQIMQKYYDAYNK